MKHINEAIAAAAQKAVVGVQMLHHNMLQVIAPTPAARKLYMAVYATSFACFMFIPSAHAQQDIAASMNTAGNTVDATKTLFGKIGLAAGAVFGVIGGGKMYQKSREGENSQVKVMTIVGCFAAGVLSAGAGAVLLRAGASVGLQSSDYGTVPGN